MLAARIAARVAAGSFAARPARIQTRTKTWYASVTMGPPDPILGVTQAFLKSTHPKKINLGVGAYRHHDGKPYILNSVRKAEEKIFNAKMNHEYAGISGVPEFVKVTQELIFGEKSDLVTSGKVVSAQALSGTGALRLGADFLKRFLPNKEVYMPQPTWGNHIPLVNDAGFAHKFYRYYDAKNIALDEAGLLTDITNAPDQSIILLHACAHNPTGVDPTQEQWKKIESVCRQKGHFVFFDAAYQGFASGDPERDVWPIRYFIEQGHMPLIAQSFAKNFGLYGERIGAVHIVTSSKDEADRVDSQLKILIRPMYSNPPVHGARIIHTIMTDPELKAEWRKEVAVMANRIISVREALVKHLKDLGSKRDWSHVTKQIGMFCYSGLTPEQVDELADKFAIYLTRNGRISMAGVTQDNVKYLAEAIVAVTKGQ